VSGRLLGIVLLVVATLTAYWGVWELGFVGYDDPDYLSANPVVQEGLSAEGASWAFTTHHAANWHPLTWLSLQLQVTLFGPGPGAAHTANLVLHLLAACILFLFLEEATGHALRSLFVALVFALHPTHVESVAWIAERKDVLSAVFGFGSLWAWSRYARTGQSRAYLTAACLLALGLSSKQMLVSWPFLFLVLNRWPQPRQLSRREELREQLPMLGICLIAGLATLWAQSAGGAMASSYELGLWPRLANAVVAFWRYVGLMFWPASLAVFYPHPYLTPAMNGIPVWQIAVASAGIVGLAAALPRLRAPVRVGWIWYALTLLPVLGLLQVGPQSHADRYTYIPFVGLCIALAWSLRTPRWLGALLLGGAVVGMVLGTRAQLPAWKDDEALYAKALRHTQHNWLAAGNLSSHYLEQGRNEEAQALLRRGLAANPEAPVLLFNMGNIEFERGDLGAAMRYYERAIQSDSGHHDALNNLGRVLSIQGDDAAAVAYLERAHELHPHNPDFETNLANSLRRSGRPDRARQHLEAVLRRYPCHVLANDVFARLEFDRNMAAAVAHARRAVECSGGGDPIPLETLAQCALRAGHLEEAHRAATTGRTLAMERGQNDRAARLQALLEQLDLPER